MKNLKRSTEIFTLLLLFVSPLVSKAQTRVSESVYTIPEGTRIRVKMDNEINSKVSSVNDTFTVTISSPVAVRDVKVLPVGTVIEGRIVAVEAAGSGKKNGRFEVRFETLRLLNNVKRVIDASLVAPPHLTKSSQVLDTVAIVGGTAIGALIGSFADKSRGALIGAGIGAGAGTATVFLKKGKEAQIKANEEFEIRLNKEVNLPAEDS